VIAPLSESVDLGALVRRLGTEYQAIAAAKGLLFRVVDRNLWARTDPSLLERALRNLIENALRYTEKGGVLLGLRRRGHRVSIIVVDTGIGIAADKQTEIFEEFYQVSNPGRDLEKGLGLGLAIVVRMAELLGAQVGVASKRGRGSGFSLSLPVDQAPAAPAISPPPPAPAIAPGGRILIIEDDPVLRVGLEAVLTQWGYEPLGAASGEGALELARRESGRFDMIIAEDRLGPGLTGMEAVEAIRRLAGRALPTLMLTGETGVTRIAELHAGDFAVLHKPATPEFLRQKLVELLAPQSR
jgi:CheY-like chemotaxis protein/anti-sigma regulatory factor (Ser/Thr protein kinase)